MPAKTFLRLAACVLGAALVASCVSVRLEESIADAARYEGVIASPIRTEADRKLDASRKPAEFLPFTGARPGMRALDVAAGGGYTSQLLALAVGPKGRLWAQSPKPGANLAKRLADSPQPQFVVAERPFDDPVPPEATDLDLVTIVNNYHDIAYLPVDRARMNARLFAALRKGGKLVVVDHAAQPGSGLRDTKTLHRIDEAAVRAEFEQAGFVLEAEGRFLRNPDDRRDKTSNSPEIPTDKFVLRFVKPR
jgi:predicted methyltransferase